MLRSTREITKCGFPFFIPTMSDDLFKSLPNGDEVFNFFMPLSKARKSDDEDVSRRYIQGIASTSDRDLQDEVVTQHGLDYSYFMTHGYFNDDHKEGPDHRVGEPTECRITPKGFWVKGFLYKNHARADAWWELINALESSGAKRKVGMSVQGKVTKRHDKTIRACYIMHVAITAAPVNTHTWLEICKALNKRTFCEYPWLDNCDCSGETEEKALTAGGMGRLLIPQSLEGGVKNTTYANSIQRVDKSLISYNDAIHEIIAKGYEYKTAKVMADTIFYQLRK